MQLNVIIEYNVPKYLAKFEIYKKPKFISFITTKDP